MVSSNMWNWVTGPDGAMVCVPNHGRQQEWSEEGKWTADMLATTKMPQTPEMMRTKKLTPWKLNGPFPSGSARGKPDSRVATPMPFSAQGSRAATAASGSRQKLDTKQCDDAFPTDAITAKGLRATFQVRFPGDPLVYDFKSWEEVNDEFMKRGYDPKNANIHTAKSGRPSTVGTRRGLRKNTTSYNDMSSTINQLASSGDNPYLNTKAQLPVTRSPVDPLHFYGSVNGSPLPVLKKAPRLPRSPPKSPSRSPTNLATVAEELLRPGVRTPSTVKKHHGGMPKGKAAPPSPTRVNTSVRPFVPKV